MKELNGVNMIQELGGDSTLVRKHRNQLMDLILNQIHIQSDRKRCREYGKLYHLFFHFITRYINSQENRKGSSQECI